VNYGMTYYAHTAILPDGSPDLDERNWQPLKDHLRNVGNLGRRFGEPLRIGAEAELAGLLHDLGKYRDEFQSYLRGERSRSVETQHAVYGAAWALEPHQQLATFLAIAVTTLVCTI
jgi:CRISPR-associated endonuclease/helicase Cas3